jgi:cobalamin biosynthesis Mg chelatase CobN
MPRDVAQLPTARFLQECAIQLQETRNAAAVVTNLTRHCSSDVLQDQLDAVRYLWRHMYGDQVVKSSAEYKSEFKKIKQHVQRMQKQAHTAEQQEEWDDACDDVLDLYDLSYAEQYDACKHGTTGYTGLPSIDSMLCSLVRMPAYVQALRCNSPRSATSGGSRSSAQDSEEGSADSSESSGSELSSDSTSVCSGSDSESTHSSLESQPPAMQSESTHNIECMVSDMLAIMQYPRCKYFELVCALAFMSGRSLADIVSVGDFAKGKLHKHYANSLSFKKP